MAEANLDPSKVEYLAVISAINNHDGKFDTLDPAIQSKMPETLQYLFSTLKQDNFGSPASQHASTAFSTDPSLAYIVLRSRTRPGHRQSLSGSPFPQRKVAS